MTYEKMIVKAKAYQELQAIVQKKPQLIREKQESIHKMELRIDELENNKTQDLRGLLNPKRYLNKYDHVAIQKEVDHLKQAITAEQNALDELKTLLPIEVVDVQKIQQEVQEIINQQQPMLDSLATKVLQAQEKYFELLQEYSDQYHLIERFRKNTSEFVINREKEKIRRDYGHRMEKVTEIEVPRNGLGQLSGLPYKMEPVTTHFKLIGLRPDLRIKEGHIKRITNHHGVILENVR